MSWSLIRRSSTDCGASLCVIYKPQEWGGHDPRWVPAPQEKRKNMWQYWTGIVYSAVGFGKDYTSARTVGHVTLASWTLLRCLNLIIKHLMTVYPRMWHYEAETRSNVEQSFSDSLQISFGPAGVRDFPVILVDARCFMYPLLNPKVQLRVTKARRCTWSWTRRIRSISTP